MTDTQRTEAIRLHGDGIATREIARRLGVPRSTAQAAIKGWRTTNEVATVAVRAEAAPAPEATQQTDGLRGFALTATTRCRDKKPVATVRSRFYGLKKNVAYRVADAVREWGISDETIRRHARDAECLRYIERGNETWEECIMHPDTAKLYPVK